MTTKFLTIPKKRQIECHRCGGHFFVRNKDKTCLECVLDNIEESIQMLWDAVNTDNGLAKEFNAR